MLSRCGSSPARRGHRIAAPKGTATRPTSDLVRETAFNLIGPVDGADVLDLFAGSGAMGLEALSRGAEQLPSSSSPTATPAARSTRTSTSCGLHATVLCQDVAARARRRARATYDLVLCDPPYGDDAARALAPQLARHPRAGRPARLRDRGARPSPRSRASRRPHLTHVRLRAAYAVRAVITAICPGTYDPVTNGHVDVITRAAAHLRPRRRRRRRQPAAQDADVPGRERVEFLLKGAFADVPNVEVDVFSELVVDFARRWDATVIVKGLRVISDFEYEFQMNQLNRTLAPDIETVYVMASPQVSFVSSSGVKEIASFGGNVEELVPPSRRAPPQGALPERPGRDPALRPGVRSSGDGRPRSDRQARRPRAQRQGRAAHRPGADRPRGDLRHPRPDARHDPRGDQAGPLDRQGAAGDARPRRSASRTGSCRRRASRPCARRRRRRSSSSPSARRRRSSTRPAARRARCGSRWRTGPTGCSRRSRRTSTGSSTAVRRGRERLHERSQETVVAGIGPIDVVGRRRRARRHLRLLRLAQPAVVRYAGRMTSFDLRQVKLRPGEEHREALEVELPAFEFGGQRYVPVPEQVPALLVITRADTGHRLRPRLHRPAARALLPLPRRRGARAADHGARVPGRVARRRAS